MTRAYGLLIRLYPRKHRAIFEQEMTAVFEEAANEHRKRGQVDFVRFVVAEMAGVVIGSCAQRISAMKYKEQPQHVLTEADCTGLPPEVAEAERRLQASLRCMEYAIAHHQFTRARFFSEVERSEREQLRELREKHGLERN